MTEPTLDPQFVKLEKAVRLLDMYRRQMMRNILTTDLSAGTPREIESWRLTHEVTNAMMKEGLFDGGVPR